MLFAVVPTTSLSSKTSSQVSKKKPTVAVSSSSVTRHSKSPKSCAITLRTRRENCCLSTLLLESSAKAANFNFELSGAAFMRASRTGRTMRLCAKTFLRWSKSTSLSYAPKEPHVSEISQPPSNIQSLGFLDEALSMAPSLEAPRTL